MLRLVPSLVCAAVVLLSSAAQGVALAAPPEHTKDSLETVKKRVEAGKAILIDVRELDEWKAGHLKQARFVPLSQLREDKGREKAVRDLPKDKIIYCHCRSGGRALFAFELLKKSGLDVRPLKPGYKDMLKAGFAQAEDD